MIGRLFLIVIEALFMLEIMSSDFLLFTDKAPTYAMFVPLNHARRKESFSFAVVDQLIRLFATISKCRNLNAARMLHECKHRAKTAVY
jgi:hypothetical protein